MQSTTGIKYDEAAPIHMAERDRELGVGDVAWPTAAPRGWRLHAGHVRRIIRTDGREPPHIPAPLEEIILRFPSAPIHGVQRLHEHHVNLGVSENFHSMRVLRSAEPQHIERPVSRIFLMHTGLNERDTMGLYYRLASQLIAREETTVCIVRPFPGHLTRYPFQAFAETPLDNYLWDGSHLFRQFLRFMIETQWLLSAVVRRSSYRCASGANLLGESNKPERGRLVTEDLAADMLEEWTRLRNSSAATADGEMPIQSGRPAVDDPIDIGQLIDVIDSLRRVLNLERDFDRHGGNLDPKRPEKPVEPKIHALGYSLGGFTAQSVFMSWPFLIASCSTLLAGARCANWRR